MFLILRHCGWLESHLLILQSFIWTSEQAFDLRKGFLFLHETVVKTKKCFSHNQISWSYKQEEVVKSAFGFQKTRCCLSPRWLIFIQCNLLVQVFFVISAVILKYWFFFIGQQLVSCGLHMPMIHKINFICLYKNDWNRAKKCNLRIVHVMRFGKNILSFHFI